MLKRIMRSTIIQLLIGWLIAAYMVLVKYTTRWDVQRFDQVEQYVGSSQGIIALTWHSRFLMLNSAWKKDWQEPHVLISRSRDGSIVDYTSRFLGLKTIRGSTKKTGSQKGKGGAKAVRDMSRAIEDGACIVMTPDGPRGPRQKLRKGSLHLARMTGSPIIPCTFSVKNRIAFRSWDRFILPLPFGTGLIVWGRPVIIPEGTSDAALKDIGRQIESEMNRDLQTADLSLGHEPSVPDESSV